ncbi:ABC transporter permease [Mesorhizobium sp. LjNodule214]|uniref:ABC transporter permease n=1 Tax=Mesorhizobium sp. LjNodule214 TaxID=3342252 RepID=UPI003ECCC9E4
MRPSRTEVLTLIFTPAAFYALLFVAPLITVFLYVIARPESLDVLSDVFVLKVFGMTTIMAAVVAAACVVLGVIYALSMAMMSPLWRSISLSILVLTFWVSLLVRTYGWILLLQPNGAIKKALELIGLVNEPIMVLKTAFASYPAMIHIMLPFAILPVWGAISSLDPATLRAAESLGAGPIRVLRTVVLPHVRQSALAGGSLVFILSYGFYVTPAFLAGPDSPTVAMLVDQQFNEMRNPAGAAVLGAALLIFSIVTYMVADRFFKITARFEHL